MVFACYREAAAEVPKVPITPCSAATGVGSTNMDPAAAMAAAAPAAAGASPVPPTAAALTDATPLETAGSTRSDTTTAKGAARPEASPGGAFAKDALLSNDSLDSSNSCTTAGLVSSQSDSVTCNNMALGTRPLQSQSGMITTAAAAAQQTTDGLAVAIQPARDGSHANAEHREASHARIAPIRAGATAAATPAVAPEAGTSVPCTQDVVGLQAASASVGMRDDPGASNAAAVQAVNAEALSKWTQLPQHRHKGRIAPEELSAEQPWQVCAGLCAGIWESLVFYVCS